VADAIAGPPLAPFDVTPALRIHPEPGWEREDAAVGPGAATVLLARGTAVLQASARAGAPASPFEVWEAYRDEALGATFEELTLGRPEEARISGAPAVEVGYVGTTASGVTVEGVVVATVTPSGAGVIFEAAAPIGDLAWAADDIVAMLGSAELR
jgi:hypothetical protein